VTWQYVDEAQRVVFRVFQGLTESTLVAFLSQEERDAIPPYQVDHAQLWERAIAEMRQLRQPILDVLNSLQTSALTLNQSDRAAVIETAKQGLWDITKIDLSDCITYDQMRQKVGFAYASLVASLPADIRQSFKEATQ